jgi:glycosyltransferase involved in cell wall biosynthesis
MNDRQLMAVYVPLYNEQEKIEEVLEQVLEFAGKRLGLLVVADDGSNDGSNAIAARHTKHVVTLPENSGNGVATRAALSYILKDDRDWCGVVRIDGDGQHDPSKLPEVFDRIEAGADVVVCSRFHPESDVSCVPADRLDLNLSAAKRMRKVMGWEITDARSGFLGFRWSLLRKIVDSLQTVRYGIPMELLLRIWHQDPSALYQEIPHPALYHLGISERLDNKYRTETEADKIRRKSDALQIFETTCRVLGIPLT